MSDAEPVDTQRALPSPVSAIQSNAPSGRASPVKENTEGGPLMPPPGAGKGGSLQTTQSVYVWSADVDARTKSMIRK